MSANDATIRTDEFGNRFTLEVHSSLIRRRSIR